MALDLQKGLKLLPNFIVAAESVIDSIGKIKALPKKDAKSIGAVLGVAEGTTLHIVLDLADDLIASA